MNRHVIRNAEADQPLWSNLLCWVEGPDYQLHFFHNH